MDNFSFRHFFLKFFINIKKQNSQNEKWIIVEEKFFIPHDFISLATHTTWTLSWILGKSLLNPKRVHIHKMTLKPMVQNSWQYNLIKSHSSSSWHNISFSAHDPSSWVSSGEFWELWFGGPRNIFSKAPVVQSW